jgi:acetolactate synthase-1/2/3 large subunit
MLSRKCDAVGITRPCVKHNFLVKDVRDLALTLKKAFHIAATGRPGPVVVDIPKDVTAQVCEFEYPKSIQMRSYNPVVKGHLGQIKKAVQLLQEAKRPIIYTGGGVILSNAAAQLTELAHQLNFPVTNTLMGLGGLSGHRPQFVGMLGMHGTIEANMAMHYADVILAVGARFDDRVIGNPAHLRGRAAQDHPHRYRPVVDLQARQGRCAHRRQRADVLEEMIKLQCRVQGQPRPDLADWWKQIAEWRAREQPALQAG